MNIKVLSAIFVFLILVSVTFADLNIDEIVKSAKHPKLHISFGVYFSCDPGYNLIKIENNELKEALAKENKLIAGFTCLPQLGIPGFDIGRPDLEVFSQSIDLETSDDLASSRGLPDTTYEDGVNAFKILRLKFVVNTSIIHSVHSGNFTGNFSK